MFASRLVTLLLAYVLVAVTVSAVPTQEGTAGGVAPNFVAREKQTPIPLTDAQVASYRPYTNYAAVAACGPAVALAWNCGSRCAANSQFKPVAAGGDSGAVQFWYVGYDPTLASVIVSFEPTDGTKIEPILTDADILLTPLPPDLFPGFSSNIRTHMGFAHAQSVSASPVLAAVRKTMSEFNATRVAVTGHSLGAAIATISIVHLKLNLPSSTTFKLVNYGSPRVGNQGFVDYVNANFPGAVARIANRYDFIPILLPRVLGFAHVEGEIHILNSLGWVSCPGQDNTDVNCSIGYVPNVPAGLLDFLHRNDHTGPYDGVEMGC